MIEVASRKTQVSNNNGTRGTYNFNDNKGGYTNNNGIKEIASFLGRRCTIAWIAADMNYAGSLRVTGTTKFSFSI